MPYSIEHSKSIELTDITKLSIVGAPKRSNSETIEKLANHGKFAITHYHRGGDGGDIPGVNYLINLPTDELIESLFSSDYILIDYIFNDRMTGIVLQAISLEIPFIIRREYAQSLGIPSSACVTYDSVDEIIANSRLNDRADYSILIDNIREYKASLLENVDTLFGMI